MNWWEGDKLAEDPWWEKDREASTTDSLMAPLKGFNTGLADTLGIPVDGANWLIGRAKGAMSPEAPPPGHTPPTLSSPEPLLGSKHLRGLLGGYDSIQEVPQNARPLARFGEVVGGAVPFAAAPLAAARTGAKGGAVINAARKAPGRFAATEGAMATGAGMGAAGAELVFPGNPVAGLAGEVAGGVASPISVLNRALNQAGGAVRRLSTSVSPTGRESLAAKTAQDLVRDAGEDPRSLALQLREPGPNLTPAQKTGSTALIGLERKLARDLPQLDNRLQSRLRQTTEGLNQAYAQAIEGGDPELVRRIAQERARWFSGLVEARVTAAEEKAYELTAGLRPQVGRGEAGITARSVLEDALGDARAAERELWGRVPRGAPVEATGTLDAYDGAAEYLLDEEGLPAPVEAFIKRIQPRAESVEGVEGLVDAPQDLTAGELLRFRSRLLAMQRNIRSSASPDWTVHRVLGDLADGALDDLAGVPGTDEARAFSYQLNNLFSRGEVGRILGGSASGGSRVPPEMTLERAIGSGGTRGAVGSRDVERAAQQEGLPGVERRTTLPSQEEFLRNAISKITNEGGSVNPQALRRFSRENRELLRQFPDLNSSLGSAAEAQDLVLKMRRVKSQAEGAIRERAAFSRLAGMESPARGVGAILSGNNPMRDYAQIARLTATGGRPALGGLRQATFDHLFSQATTPQGLVSGRRMRELLTRKTTPGTPTLLDAMIQNRVISPEQRQNLFRVMDAAERVENAMESGARIGEAMSDVTALEDLLTRVVGANIGGASAAGQISGAPLVAAQAGSQFARRLTQKIPVAKTQEILADAIESPELMAALLEKGKAPKPRRSAERQINAWLLQTANQDESANQE